MPSRQNHPQPARRSDPLPDRRGRPCGDVSDQAGAHPGALCGRRRRRRAGAHHRAVAVENLGPAARDREPSRRRRHHCVAGADAIAARRLHPDPGRERSSIEPVLLSKTALRHLQGLYRDQRSRGLAARDRGVEDQPGEEPRRTAGDRARKTGIAVLRHVRQRHLGASGRRTAQLHGQDQDPRHPLQGRRAGPHRRDRGRNPDERQSAARSRRPARRRRGAGAGGHHGGARRRRCRMCRRSRNPACPVTTPRCGGDFWDPPAWRRTWSRRSTPTSQPP